MFAFSKTLWVWLVAHQAIIGAASVAVVVGSWWTLKRWLKQIQIRRCARRLRTYAQRVTLTSASGLSSFSIVTLSNQLGRSGAILDDVMEYMEEKGWAKKLKAPVGYWEIR